MPRVKRENNIFGEILVIPYIWARGPVCCDRTLVGEDMSNRAVRRLSCLCRAKESKLLFEDSKEVLKI